MFQLTGGEGVHESLQEVVVVVSVGNEIDEVVQQESLVVCVDAPWRHGSEWAALHFF